MMTYFTQEQAVEMVVQIGADEKDCPWATLTPEELTALVNLAADRATKHQDALIAGYETALYELQRQLEQERDTSSALRKDLEQERATTLAQIDAMSTKIAKLITLVGE